MPLLTKSDYEKAGLGDRLRTIMDLMDLLKGLDMSQIGELMTAIQRVGSATTLKEAIKSGLGVFSIIAKMTPDEGDDRLLAVINSVMSDELLDLIGKIVGGMISPELRTKFSISESVALTTSEAQMVEAKAIPVSFLFQVALQLLPLLERFFREKVS